MICICWGTSRKLKGVILEYQSIALTSIFIVCKSTSFSHLEGQRRYIYFLLYMDIPRLDLVEHKKVSKIDNVNTHHPL